MNPQETNDRLRILRQILIDVNESKYQLTSQTIKKIEKTLEDLLTL